MDGKNLTGGGVKVTYIETQFVTSDAAGFKDLVQRLTGRSAPPPQVPHRRPLPCRPDDDGARRGWSSSSTAAGAGPVPQAGGAYQYGYGPVAEVRPAVISSSSRSTPTSTYLEDMGLLHDDVMDMADFSDLFYVGASQRSDACYGGFQY